MGCVDRMKVWTCRMSTWPTQQKEQRKPSGPRQQASRPSRDVPRLQTDPRAQNPGEILLHTVVGARFVSRQMEGYHEVLFGIMQ